MSRGLPCLLPLILLTALPTPAHAHTTPPPAPIALTPDTLGDAPSCRATTIVDGASLHVERDGQAYAPPR